MYYVVKYKKFHNGNEYDNFAWSGSPFLIKEFVMGVGEKHPESKPEIIPCRSLEEVSKIDEELYISGSRKLRELILVHSISKDEFGVTTRLNYKCNLVSYEYDGSLIDKLLSKYKTTVYIMVMILKRYGNKKDNLHLYLLELIRPGLLNEKRFDITKYRMNNDTNIEIYKIK